MPRGRCKPKQFALFAEPRAPKLPRPPVIKRAHAIDTGETFDGGAAVFRCKRCAWNSGWHHGLTNAEIRRGLECPACNAPNAKKEPAAAPEGADDGLSWGGNDCSR